MRRIDRMQHIDHWDYRVTHEHSLYSIREVYYDENNKPHSWSERPVYPMGETIEELNADLTHYMNAYMKPVLYISDDRILGG